MQKCSRKIPFNCPGIALAWATTSPPFESLVETGLILSGQTILAGFYFGLLQMLRERRLFRRKRRSD